MLKNLLSNLFIKLFIEMMFNDSKRNFVDNKAIILISLQRQDSVKFIKIDCDDTELGTRYRLILNE